MKLIPVFSLAAQESPSWLLEGLVPRESFAVLYGKPKAGKSLLALDWALQIAHRGEPVLYVAGEGLGGYGKRLKAWYEVSGEELNPETPLLFCNQLDLGDGGTVSRLIKATTAHELWQGENFDDIEGYVEYVKNTSLVVIDTLSRSLPGGDENDAAAMTQAIQNIDLIRTMTKAAVLVIHHQTKDSADDENARERGSSTLRGAADVMLHMSTRSKVLSVNAARDFESGAAWNYTIKPVLSSVVCEVGEPVKKDDERLGSAQEKVLGAIDGVVTTGDVVGKTYLSTSQVVHTLRALIAKGLVERVSHGKYQLAEGGLDSAEPL